MADNEPEACHVDSPPWPVLKVPIPPNELSRVTAVHDSRLLDTPPETAFNDLAALLAKLCQAPMALISVLDTHRQWNKAVVGLDMREIARGHSFCAHTICQEACFVVEDAATDARFQQNPLVSGPAAVRFYAGVPVRSADGLAVGAIAVMDASPRVLSLEVVQILDALARQAAALIELRRQVVEFRGTATGHDTARREHQSLYLSLAESLPQNIIRKDLQGRFTYANTKFCTSLQRHRGAIIGKTDHDLFPPELAEAHRLDDRQVMSSGQVKDLIELHRTSDGGVRHVHVIKTPLLDGAGNAIGIQIVFWDETEQIKARETFAHEHALLEALLGNIPDSIWLKDRESRFMTVNQAMAREMRLASAQAAAGKTDHDFFAPEYARELFQVEQGLLRTGQPVIAKTELEVWSDGRQRWVQTTRVPFRGPCGDIQGTFGISRDITEIKNTERALAAARDAAVDSTRLKSEFLANMSHEIRTPMNAIIGMTGLLLDTELQGEQRDFAETVRASADALLNIINDILDFSKIEAGKLAIEIIDFDLDELVEGTIETLAESARTRKNELVCWVHPEIPRRLRGDPGRMRQVLTNLAANAVKFTHDGEVVVDVSLLGIEESVARVRFSVRDTGIGIRADAQKRLFQAFTQEDGSTTRRYGGTGLGLAITKQLVELMGGAVGFTSRPGAGSTFWCDVPLKINTSAVSPGDRLTASLDNRRVLIVDDNATNRQILHHQLAAWRMRPAAAAGGEEALLLLREAARSDPFELAILDMQMPGMDGVALAREIKAAPEIGAVKLVMLTSLGHLTDGPDWRAAGIEAQLVKPARLNRLREALEVVLRSNAEAEHESAPKEPAAAPAPPEAVQTQVRILLAEDNQVNRKVALRQLQKLGYGADAVENGAEALNALDHIRYGVILMDCQMPELDGYEATRRIRQRVAAPGSAQPYIIAMTANALVGDRETCLAAGMNDYISKPVRIDEMEAAIQRGLIALKEAAVAAAGTPCAGASVDRAVLESLRELRMPGEPDPLAELIHLFLDDSPARLLSLRKAVEQADTGAVESAAHGLKGSASNLGAQRLAALCARLMHQARKAAFEQPEMAVAAIEQEFATVKSTLLEELNR